MRALEFLKNTIASSILNLSQTELRSTLELVVAMLVDEVELKIVSSAPRFVCKTIPDGVIAKPWRKHAVDT